MLIRFFSWWLIQLAGLVPPAVRRGLRHRGQALCVFIEPDRVRAAHRKNSRVRVIGEASTDSGGEPSPGDGERLWTLAQGLRPEESSYEITVASELALVKEIELPVAAQENLRQVIGFEIRRFTPFTVDDVYYDHAVIENREDRLRVQLAVVPRRVVDRATAWLPGKEHVPSPESPRGSRQTPLNVSDGSVTFEFRDPSYRAARGRGLYATLLVFNLLLAGTAVAIPVVQEQKRLDDVKARLEQARRAATATAEIRREVDQLRTKTQFLVARASSRVSTVVLIEELTALLPDTTWVFRFELVKGVVHLQGSSETATSLIATLEDSKMLSKVEFASPVVREGGSGRDRFHITAQVTGPRERQ